ncbi:unnamed protein product, partial [Gulo gulo]
RTGSTDPCNSLGLFACPARSPQNQEGLRELRVLWLRCRLLQISETHDDGMTKKPPPAGSA